MWQGLNEKCFSQEKRFKFRVLSLVLVINIQRKHYIFLLIFQKVRTSNLCPASYSELQRWTFMPTEIWEGGKYIMKSKISNHKSDDLPKKLVSKVMRWWWKRSDKWVEELHRIWCSCQCQIAFHWTKPQVQQQDLNFMQGSQLCVTIVGTYLVETITVECPSHLNPCQLSYFGC